MMGKWLLVSVLGVSLTILSGVNAPCLAQPDAQVAGDDNTAEDQIQEEKAQQALRQIHDLEQRMQDTGKRLDALEKAVNEEGHAQPINETSTLSNTTEEMPETVAVEPALATKPAAMEQAPKAFTPPAASSYVLPVELHSHKYYAPAMFLPKEHLFEFGLEDFYAIFKEPGDSSKKGEFYGIYGAYTYRPLGAENQPLNVFHGDVHADYGLDNEDFLGDGSIKDVNNYTVEPRVWVGKDFNFGTLGTMTPYIGIGYRWYYDQLRKKFSDAQDDHGGNNVQTQYLYVPVGGQLTIVPAEGWHMVLDTEYDYVAWGRITNYSADFNVDGLSVHSPEYSNILRHGYGLRASLKIVKEGNYFNYFVEPYIRYWNISASKAVSATGTVDGFPVTESISEDKNHTTEVGAILGVEF